MKRIVTLLLTMIVLCSGAFAAGSQEETKSDKSKLRFATTWGEADSKGVYFVPMLKEFAEQNADTVDLEIETYNSDDMVTKITVELASGELPDMFSYWGGKQRLGPLVEGNALLDMEKYFSESPLSREDFSSAGIDHFTIDGVLRGIPMESNVAAFVCNREIFDKYGLKLPETFDDMKAAGKVLRANGIIPFAMASNGGNPSHFWFSEMYKQFEGGLTDIQNLSSTMIFDTPTALKVARVIDDLRVSQMYPGDTVSNGNWGPAFALYNEEKAAMIYTYPWMLGSMSQGVQDKSVVIDVPQIPGSKVDTSTFISGFATFGFTVNDKSWNNASKKPGLKKFIDFMVSDEMFNALMQGGLIPTKVYDMPFDAFNDIMQQTLQHYQGRAQTTSHFWNIDEPAVATAFKGGLDELHAGIISPDEFVRKVQQSFDNAK